MGRALIALVVAALVYYLVPLSRIRAADEWVRGAVAVAGIAVLCVLFAQQLRRQVRAGSRNDVRIQSLVLLMVLAVFGFSLAYFIVSADPHQFVDLRTRTDALYFTLSTLATVGYGDVHAAGQAARILVICQIVFNLLFIGSAVAVVSAAVRGRLQADR
ncbi:potassium channel family protein [Dactylosporangium sp. AC04546]|uniref:potassium channel family protein n=1 Tax=Dactylosporangium sp. AC04546 TaxID=2862460 RepID=UPI001EDE85DD|nr:potassium channel family protein [Dactylosporangium sp. AC04546]WVK84624.1 potassium channel family protein [Dactylosporangium sp. AC04546]